MWRLARIFAFHPLSKPEHVDRAMHARFGRLHRVTLVMDRRGWTGQIVDLVDLEIEREGHVVANSSKRGSPSRCSMFRRAPVKKLSMQMTSGPSCNQAIAEMRAEKARAASHQDTLLKVHGAKYPPQ